MSQSAESKAKLASLSAGSAFSFEISGDHVVSRLFGLIPIRRINLGAVRYLRLATPSDASALYCFMNWPHFLLTSKRSKRPVYILLTHKGQKIFMKLEGGAHFRLRQAIGHHSDRQEHRKAA